MDKSHQPRWKDHNIDVQARLVPRFLWTTASIDVYLDGKCILKTGGQLKSTGSRRGNFADADGVHAVDLRWGIGYLRSFPYTLSIDDQIIYRGRVLVSNWPLGLLVMIVIW